MREVQARANRCANALRGLGLRLEDRVLLVLEDRPEFAFAWFGVAKAGGVIAMVNPQVSWASDARTSYEEGCLSIPEQYAEVTRPAEVKVCWQDVAGTAHEEHFTGLWATCVQHEIDHLNGRLFIDYLTPLKRQLITRKMEKLKRERARDGEHHQQKDWL